MRRTALALAALLAAAAAPAQAQSGFALKGHYLYNSSTADGARADRDIPSEDGFSLGAELVLPLNVGVGVSAYANGRAREADIESQSFGLVAEANYFFGFPVLPIRPYAGVHAGLGRYTYQDVSTPEIKDDRTQLGFQVGLRWQVTSLLGLDAQYRRVSDSASSDQSPDLERNQVLVGVTLF